MFKPTKKKVLAAVVGGALLIGASGIAYAYWTGGGSGDDTAATGVSVGLTAVQTTDPTDLRPDGEPQALSGTFLNTNDGPVYVSTVTASLASVTQTPAGILAGPCTTADYLLTNPVMTVNAEASDDDTTTWGTVDTAMVSFDNDPAVNQDGCQGATLNIHYVIV